MVTTTVKVNTTTHVFTSEKEFLPLEVWIQQNKGTALFEEWQARERLATEESMTHPDSISFYEEWLADQGVTHTQTKEE
jgi:hypothetical protein